jgi:transposase
MAWKTMDVHEQRVRFVVAAFRREKPLGALCAEFEVSRPTGYRWLERYRAHGVEGIAEHSRRPHRSPGQTAVEREQQVVQMRLRYPDWGARKLQVLLNRDGLALTRSTIHRSATPHPTALDGLLLLHPDTRNRPRCPALDDRRALGKRSSTTTEM